MPRDCKCCNLDRLKNAARITDATCEHNREIGEKQRAGIFDPTPVEPSSQVGLNIINKPPWRIFSATECSIARAIDNTVEELELSAIIDNVSSKN